MHSILELSYVWLVAIIFGLTFSFAVIVHLVTEHSLLSGYLSEYRHILAAALTAVAVLFGLFSAFVGADIWERVRQERQSVEREVAAVQTIDTIAESMGQQGAQLDRSLKRYVEICVPGMMSATSKADADEALDEVARQILDVAYEPRGQVAALIIFSAAFSVTLAALAIHENPMVEQQSISIEALSNSVEP